MRSLILFFSFLLSTTAFGNNCNVYDQIHGAGLDNNEKFWEEFATLQAQGDIPPGQLGALLSRYRSSDSPSPSPSAPPVTTQIRANQTGLPRSEIRKNAQRAYEAAPPQVQARADELVRLFEEKGRAAIQDLRSHGWNYEYIREQGKHSVRLNGGVRALISVDGDRVTIWDIGNNVYRH